MTLLIAGVLAGCQSLPPHSAPTPAGSATSGNNCYSLLHQLLTDQQDIRWLHFIKHEPAEIKVLMGRIAAASGAGARLLAIMAREDPAIRLDVPQLPAGETATREAIAATKQHELLEQTGEAFELSLLLTEAEALTYAWHLADVARVQEANPGHARALAGIAADMKNLHQEVFVLLLSRTTRPAHPAVAAPRRPLK